MSPKINKQTVCFKDLVDDLRYLTGPDMEDFILGVMLSPEIYDSSALFEVWSVSLRHSKTKRLFRVKK